MLALGVAYLSQDTAGAVGNIESLPSHDHEPDRDFREGSVEPTPGQVSAARELDATTRWNRFGTPQSMINYNGFLATGVQGSNATEAAREFLVDNAGVFGLGAGYLGGNDNLRAENDTPMEGSNGHAVFFRQYFGDLPAIKDGSVTVGLTGSAEDGWKVAYVSSSLTKNTDLAATPTDIGPEEAWVAAADAVGESFGVGSVTARDDRTSSFTLLQVDGLNQIQRARLTALPIPGEAARPAYETIFLNDVGGHVDAYTQFVDASSREVLVRANNVQQFFQVDPPSGSTTEVFEGEFDANSCSEPPQEGPFTVGSGNTSIQVVVNADNIVNDIVIQLFFGPGTTDPVATADTATSPEAINYEPEGGVPAGDYYVRVCSFENAEPLPPNTYQGAFAASGAGTGEPVAYPPEWEYFFANPPIGEDNSGFPSDDTRNIGCWNSIEYEDPYPTGCDLDVANSASRGPWDTNARTGAPTFTTSGNNARSTEAWSNFRGPGPTGYQPSSTDRKYSTNTTAGTDYEWTNVWHESGCDPANYATPGVGNDISAAVASLFASHNRMHDWSYNLGFTEQAYNLQESNYGTTQPSRENDPELGQAQAGAAGGNAPPQYVGRNNANQTTLNDGVAPITNMYLWQPLPGLFYSPCVDGDYDMSVIAHEYGHAIQNRMVAGPDEGLSGLQARSMGESWSDLTAIEYLYEYGYEPGGGANRYAVGPYVTGDKQAGIRNYGMNQSPLNYSNIEYDPNGVASPHADGEIWSATNFDMRALLMKKYKDKYAAPDSDLQMRCAEGERPARKCPGNRRWAQLFHDAFLLMPSAVSFVDARDAYLAAERMRFSGRDSEELWLAFARRGLGQGASSNGTDDRDPKPSFASPLADNARITFKPVNGKGKVVEGFEVFVGDYEARAVPVGTNDAASENFAPGTYEFVVRAPGYGLYRFTRTFKANQNGTVRFDLRRNLASSANGATASGDATSGDDGNSSEQLIDDTEETNWRADGTPDVEGKQVTVDLAGGSHNVESVKVSSFLRPQEPSNNFGDTDTQSRFSALRGFEILTCRRSAGNDCSDPDRGFRKVYTNPDTANRGPSSAGAPRPTAPDLGFLTYNVRDTQATHVQLRVVSNQCTGGEAYRDPGDPATTDQDNDPTTETDCAAGSDQDEVVRAAELQVFGR